MHQGTIIRQNQVIPLTETEIKALDHVVKKPDTATITCTICASKIEDNTIMISK